MAKLTKRTVDSSPPKVSEYFVWDDAIPSFGLRVLPASSRYPNGTKTFILQYRNKYGDTRRLKLGRMGQITPDKARELAKEHLAAIASGHDPQEEKRQQKEAINVNQLSEMYMDKHARQRKRPRSIKSDETLLRLHILPVIGSKKVDAITRKDIVNLHHKMKDTPGAANRTLALISKMFNLAEKWEIRPDHTNPCLHVEKYDENQLERYLSETEFAELSDVLTESERTGTESPSVIAAIRLLIFTGARVSEILNLEWSQVDFTSRCLRLTATNTKEKKKKTIQLPPAALEVINSIERQDDSPWVITGKVPGNPLVNIRKPWGRIRKRASLNDVRLHDLRHSFASVAVSSGMSLPMIGALLGHTQSQTTQRYAHLADDPMKDAVNTIGNTIDAAMKRNEGEVIDMADHRK
jgi:integrase